MAPKKAPASAGTEPPVDPLPGLFDELLRHAQQDDGERVVKTADKSECGRVLVSGPRP